MKLEPPLLIILFLFLAMPKIGLCPFQTPPEIDDLVVVNENSVLARYPIQVESQTLGTRYSGASLGVKDDIFEDLKYKTLIKCLARRESSMNPYAIGDHGNAMGLLQFWQATWDMYCEGDIFSAENQVECCDAMLIEDFRNITHWTTRIYCLYEN